METEPCTNADPEQQLDLLVVPPLCGARTVRMQLGAPASVARLAAEGPAQIAAGTAQHEGGGVLPCAPEAEPTVFLLISTRIHSASLLPLL